MMTRRVTTTMTSSSIRGACTPKTSSSFVVVVVVAVSFCSFAVHAQTSAEGGDGGGVERRRVVKIGVILPSSKQLQYSMSRVRPAIEHAVAALRDGRDGVPLLLPGADFSVTYGDSMCSDTEGPLVAIDMYLHRQADVFFGPVCHYAVAPVARFSPHWNVPVVTAGALVHAFSNKTQYRLLTRIAGSYDQLGAFFAGPLPRHFRWTSGRPPALVYHQNLGERQVNGKSDCFFHMESIAEALRTASLPSSGGAGAGAGGGSGKGVLEIWYRHFDEAAEPEERTDMGYLLGEMSKNARSKASAMMCVFFCECLCVVSCECGVCARARVCVCVCVYSLYMSKIHHINNILSRLWVKEINMIVKPILFSVNFFNNDIKFFDKISHFRISVIINIIIKYLYLTSCLNNNRLVCI